MELSEKERLMLVKKKEEILELTCEILEIMNDPAQALQVKKKITRILSKLSTIACYAGSDRNLDNLSRAASMLFAQIDMLSDAWTSLSPLIQFLCNTFNTIQFNFTKSGINIKVPKIDLTIFRSG